MQYQGGKEKIAKYIAAEISLAGMLARGGGVYKPILRRVLRGAPRRGIRPHHSQR